MTFPDQGTPPDPGGQVPPAPQKEKEGDSESGGGIRQWLIDTYNGLYVIVLKPRMPEGMLYSMAIIGFLVGILWGWFVTPVVWKDNSPASLTTEYQEQWLKMVAVGSSRQNLYGPDQIIELAQRVPDPVAQIEIMLQDPNLNSSDQFALQGLLQQLQQSPDDVDAGSAEPVGGGNIFVSLLMSWIVPIILIIILVVVITLLWRFLIYDNLVAPVLQQFAEMRDPELRARNQKAREEIKIQQQQRELREQLAKEDSGSDLGAPVMTQLAIYTPGRSFDESYEIELESGEFLGQSGAVLAEAVDPDPVAIEVWLFDMFSSRNIAKVFITPQGNADPAIRSKVEADVDNPATDIIVAEAGKPLTIDTDKLRLEAKFASLDFNASGRYENFNLQMRAWNKDAATSSAAAPPPPAPAPVSPAGAPDMSTYDNISFDPPPPMPSGSSSPPPMTPLSPPPLRPQDGNDDDDPFGGTGDFTPLGGS